MKKTNKARARTYSLQKYFGRTKKNKKENIERIDTKACLKGTSKTKRIQEKPS